MKLWREKINPDTKLQREVITIVVFGLSLGIGFIWLPPEMPILADDPMAYLTALFLMASPWFTSVKIIYDFIMKRVFEKIGWV